MIFGPTPLADAAGAILAHSLTLDGKRYGKGKTISEADIAAFRAAGLQSVITARPAHDDMGEDAAAKAVAGALVKDATDVSVSAPFTGRVNVFAEDHGLLRVDAKAINAANAVDEAVTIATLPDHARVSPRQMVATIKIIPYAARTRAVDAVQEILTGANSLRLYPRTVKTASVFLTRTAGMKDKLLNKGGAAVAARLTALGVNGGTPLVTPHTTEALANALRGADGDMIVILGGSATADRHDIAPAAVIAAGGRIERFGMPVDPGNLLFIGTLDGRPVVGLPGCARSPKLNGADWVLERVVSGISVTDSDIQTMGVGGLLKEIPSRPQPRAANPVPARPFVSGILLAAGASSRMRGKDKLTEQIEDTPLLRRSALRLLASGADEVIVIIRPDDPARHASLLGLDIKAIENPLAVEGMGASIRAGMSAISSKADAVLISLADMPDLTTAGYDSLIAAFSPEDGREIIRASDGGGTPGNPVMFGRRFFESLRALEGDEGARHILAAHRDLICLIGIEGATTDLDAPEDWATWREARKV
ncbi:MAG: NTP transferase domain-containing protein [Pikeienuella sp.]